MKKLLLLFTFIGFASGIFAQVSKTVNMATAGTLSTSLTSNELATISNLTLTGTIDASDFKTMRDNMPLLAVLDLGGVMITAYNGTGGTSLSNNDYPSNAFPADAFLNSNTWQGKRSLTTVTIPTSVTSIGDWAFEGCSGLTTVSIPSSVTSIGIGAFSGCSGLTTVTIPSSVTSIGDSAFYSCSGLTTVAIPSSVTSIGYGALAYCSGLTTVTIPSSVRSIGASAFANCSGLTTVTIPFSVTSIGDWAFESCIALITVDSNNPNYSGIDGVLYNKAQTTLIQCPISKIGSFTIPSSVILIGGDAFYNCSRLTTITIPSSVTSIGIIAFGNCSSLTTVTIPASVTSIGDEAFAGCSGLTSITTSRITPLNLSASTNVFYQGNTTTCTLIVPYDSKSAYQVANQWKDFTNIIEAEGFKLSSNTVNVAAAEGSTATVDVTANVEWAVSSDQTWLVVSPASGTGNNTLTFTAEANAPVGTRKAIMTITATGIGSQMITVTQVGCNVLLNITAGGLASALTADELSTISNLTLTGTIDASDFKTMRDKMPLLAVLYLNGVTIVAYNGKGGTYYSRWGNYNYPANAIPDYTFLNPDTRKSKTSLISIVLPSSVTSIEDNAFANCIGLTTFTIPSSVTSIGDGAFAGCSGLTTFTIPSSVTSIGEGAFDSCSGLTSITTTRLTPIDLSSSSYVFYRVNKTTCTLYVPVGSKSVYQAADQWKDFTNIVEKDLTGIAPIIGNQQLIVYPNPTSGKVKLVFDQIPQGGTTLTVNDFTGKTILTQFIQNKEEWINLGGNTPGVYLIRTNMKDFKVQKVILK